MALPNSNISTTLVGNTLGSSSRDVGTLCTHQNINKWSKYKPVIQPLTNTDSTPTWWRSQNGNCGLIIPTFSSLSALISHVDTNGSDWAYQRPTGGATSPFRLGDFRQYEHNARRPFIPNTPASTYYKDTVSIPVSMNTIVSTAYELLMSDIGNALNMGSMYFGAAMVKAGTPNHITEIDNITTAGGGGVEIPLAGFAAGNYNIYMLLASVSKTTFSSTATGTFIPLPGGKFTVEKLDVYKVRLFINGDMVIGTPNTLNFTVWLFNDDTVQQTRSNITVGWRYGDNATTDPLEMGESSEVITSMTANANSSYSLTFSKKGALPNFETRGGYFYLQCGSHPELNITRQDIGSGA